MLGESFDRDVESRAMVHRSPDERQSEGYVHRLAKRQTLYRNHRLIVITRDHRIELSTRGTQKNRVCRERPLHIYIINATRGFDRRHDFRRFFDSKQSAFSTVRIQRRNGQPRTLDAPTLKLTMRKT